MAQAIVVKCFPASNTKPARYSVSCAALKRSIVLSQSPGGIDRTPLDAALIVCEMYKWGSNYAQGQLRNGDFVFVCVDDLVKELQSLQLKGTQ